MKTITNDAPTAAKTNSRFAGGSPATNNGFRPAPTGPGAATKHTSIDQNSPGNRSPNTYDGRWLDLVIGGAMLTITAPILAVLAVVIRLDSRGPVLYRQDRLGQDGTPFRCLKLRTMHADADESLVGLLAQDPSLAEEWAATAKLRRDCRVTRVGRLLRPFGLDELPQLVNVVRGEMSLVGPRPIPDVELARYGSHAADLLSVRPGLTGAWQIGGRSDTTYDRRVEIDVDYVRSRSLVGDGRILARTIIGLLRGSLVGGY